MNSCLKLSLQQNCLIIVLKNVAHRGCKSSLVSCVCVCVCHERNDISIQIPISDENMPSRKKETGFIFTTFVLKTFVAKVKFLFSETTFNWILCKIFASCYIFVLCELQCYSVLRKCEKKEQRSDKMSYIGRVYLFTY